MHPTEPPRLACVEVYGPVNLMGSCQARLVYLITLLLGRLRPLSGKPVLCTFFRQKLITALLESAEENDRRKYFMITLHKRMLPTRQAWTSNLLITNRTRIQLSHWGWLSAFNKHQQHVFSWENISFLGLKKAPYLELWNYSINPKYWDTVSTNHTSPKIWNSPFYYVLMCVNIAVYMANWADPDQTPTSAASDLGLHCLQTLICPNT